MCCSIKKQTHLKHVASFVLFDMNIYTHIYKTSLQLIRFVRGERGKVKREREKKRERERERKREREKKRERERETERDSERETETEKYGDRKKEREKQRQRGKQKEREREEEKELSAWAAKGFLNTHLIFAWFFQGDLLKDYTHTNHII